MKPKSNPPDPMLEQAIRQRAYELYVQRGKTHGHAIDDWLEAEGELRGPSSASYSARILYPALCGNLE
jgi:hypothetical protein